MALFEQKLGDQRQIRAPIIS